MMPAVVSTESAAHRNSSALDDPFERPSASRMRTLLSAFFREQLIDGDADRVSAPAKTEPRSCASRSDRATSV